MKLFRLVTTAPGARHLAVIEAPAPDECVTRDTGDLIHLTVLKLPDGTQARIDEFDVRIHNKVWRHEECELYLLGSVKNINGEPFFMMRGPDLNVFKGGDFVSEIRGPRAHTLWVVVHLFWKDHRSVAGVVSKLHHLDPLIPEDE